MVTIFGRDYATAVGTCVRDCIHTCDLCAADLLALRQIGAEGRSRVYNLVNGNGFSVQEVIATAHRVTGLEIKVLEGARPSSASAVLVADAALARRDLGREPGFAELATIIDHAWRWECRGNG